MSKFVTLLKNQNTKYQKKNELEKKNGTKHEKCFIFF